MVIAWLLNRWRDFRSTAPLRFLTRTARRKRRVRFSPCTLERERQREAMTSTPATPFEYFFNEMRFVQTEEAVVAGSELANLQQSMRSRQVATIIWQHMSQENRQMYVDMAAKAAEIKRRLEQMGYKSYKILSPRVSRAMAAKRRARWNRSAKASTTTQQ